MRLAVSMLILAGFAAACSDTVAPRTFEPEVKTYTLQLTSCIGCSESTPSLARIFQDGVTAEIAVENVTPAGADANVQALHQGASSLLAALPSKNFSLTRNNTGAYSGVLSYGEGSITIGLQADGCTFRLNWPGVSTGAGACLVQ